MSTVSLITRRFKRDCPKGTSLKQFAKTHPEGPAWLERKRTGVNRPSIDNLTPDLMGAICGVEPPSHIWKFDESVTYNHKERKRRVLSTEARAWNDVERNLLADALGYE